MKKLINFFIFKFISTKYKTSKNLLAFKENSFICPCEKGFLVLNYFNGILFPVKLFKFNKSVDKAQTFAEELKDLLKENLNY